MPEEFVDLFWLLGTFFLCVICSYYLYSPELIEYDYNTDLEVDSANTTTSEDSDSDYKTSSDGSDSDSDGSDKLYYDKEFLGELPVPFIEDIHREEYQTDIFEDSYVDDKGNVSTKYTFVSNEVKFK